MRAACTPESGAFVAVNCGAIPAPLVESHLFGHVKGAFSGAVRDEAGYVRAAHRGTLFLDEIAELPRTSPAALLRGLQEREVVPVGTTAPVAVDLRVLAATHQPLDLLVERGDFRQDLYARVAGCVLEIPALRERRDDIGILVAALLAKVAPGAAGGDHVCARRGAGAPVVRMADERSRAGAVPVDVRGARRGRAGQRVAPAAKRCCGAPRDSDGDATPLDRPVE